MSKGREKATMRLKGQVAIVTGGGQGIGQQIALRLGQEGATVVIADINREGSFQTAEMIRQEQGPPGKVVFTDITVEAQVIDLIKETCGIQGRIDILVNNSGVMGPIKNIEDISAEEWDGTMSVNLKGMFFCCKHSVPVMKRQQKGNIVNISSVVAKRPLPQRTPYASTKMGVIGFTRSLATELGQWKIRVNSICPGEVTGPRLDRYFKTIVDYSGKNEGEVIAQRLAVSPLRSFVDPKYIGAMVAFLCSDDAAMITGQDINVSAGAVMY
jgi:NAD(P)-dependent dehydrogenase (short-subunit alcohol dehydrogenase family)